MGTKTYQQPGGPPTNEGNQNWNPPAPPDAVSSVFGRTGAVVAVAGDYTASKVTNDSHVTGSSVAAALDAIAAAIPSVPVSSVFGRIGAVLATLGDYAASLITNDSSVAGTTVKDALNTLLAAAGGTQRTDAFLLSAPTAPDAWDLDAAALQAAGASPDLAVLGWTVKFNGAPYTTLTRNGPIQPGISAMPPAGTYNSSFLNNRLVMQFPGPAGVEIVKASSGPFCYRAHFNWSNWDNSIEALAFVAQGNNFDQAGNNIAYFGRENNSINGISFVGPASFTTAFSVADAATEFNQDRVYYIYDAGSGAARNIGVELYYPNGVHWRAALPAIVASFTTSSAGILFTTNNANGPNWLYIDSIRRLPITAPM